MRTPFTEKDAEIAKQQLKSKITELDTKASKSDAEKEYLVKLKAQPELTKDSTLEVIAKFIPAEVLTFYVGAFAAIDAVEVQIPYNSLSLIIFGLGIVFTFIFAYTNCLKEQPLLGIRSWMFKSIIITLAFIIWSIGLGKPWSIISGWNTVYGTIIIMSFTLIWPKVYDLLPASPPPAQPPPAQPPPAQPPPAQPPPAQPPQP